MMSSFFLSLKIKIPIRLSVQFFESLDDWLRWNTAYNPNIKTYIGREL